jgi:hypothetical protein
MSSATADFLAAIRSRAAFSAAQLMPLYLQLEPVSVDFMLGTWHGGKFDGGVEPDPINWYGKRFVSRDHAEPLLCRAADGSIFAYEKLGRARLRELGFGGKISAGLIYDNQPIMDYFRKVSDDVVIGLGDIKGRPLDFFFHLTRE